MATNIEYSFDGELDDAVASMLQKREFKNIVDVGVKIAACMLVRVDADGNTQPPKGSPIRMMKVSPLHRLLMDKKPHYLLVMDYHWWNEAEDRARRAMLHHGLCYIEAQKAEGNELVLKMRKPDFVLFTATVSRYGAWSEVMDELADAFASKPGRFLPATEEAEEPEPEIQDEPQAAQG